jgi:hypothetical protein
MHETHGEVATEGLAATLVEDNGTTFAYFRGNSASEPKAARFCIEIHASIKLEAHPLGCRSLSIPGLPLQSGGAEGTFTLEVLESSSALNDTFKAYEKVAYVDDDFCIQPLQHEQVSHSFRLDTPFSINLLCFDACRILEPSSFEIDSDVHTRYDWENLDGDGITAEHSMICSIRLHPFLMWAENVKLKLYLIGGPSGTLETRLEPGSRRIYLDGLRCDSEHELEISITCRVEDLQKTFMLSWEQSLGVAPFESWLPRISGLHRTKLEDVFDLPYEGGVSINPRPCKKSRAYSMAAQADSLRARSELSFFPENQHTPRKIRRSLAERSGQFYDELTAEDPESNSATPAHENPPRSPKHATITLKPSKWQRPCQSGSLRKHVADIRPCAPTESRLDDTGEIPLLVEDAAKPLDFVPVEEGPYRSTSFLIRGVCVVLNVVSWFVHCLVGAGKAFKIMFLVWLCVRALDRDRVVLFEKSVMQKGIEMWERWDFEPVQLHDDFTGWKHLMAKVNHGAARVVQNGHLGVRSPIEAPSEDTLDKRGDTSDVDDEVPRGATFKEDQPMMTREELEAQITLSAEDQNAGEEVLTFLDRIDIALGWKAPSRQRRNDNKM